MRNFSIPSNFRKETIDQYAKLNEESTNSRIIETYGQITVGNTLASGRPVSILQKIDIKCLSDYISYSMQKGIGFSYTLNASCLGNKEFSREGMIEIVSFLGKLYAAGVRSLTIALPSLIELVGTLKYDFLIKASVICQITNPNKAMFFKKMGVNRLVIDESLNRRFGVLRDIRDAFGEQVEIIVNSICHKDCVYRMFHYNEISHDFNINSSENSSIAYYPHRCIKRRYEDISNFIKLTWIRPEDIKYYENIGISHFKIQGRQSVLTGDPVSALRYYFDEKYDGNLLELLDLFSPLNSFNINIDNSKLDGFVKTFYENPEFCKDNCEKCGYCSSYANKCINGKESEEVREMALKFYSEYDDFSNMVCSAQSEVSATSSGKELFERLSKNASLNCDFDLD